MVPVGTHCRTVGMVLSDCQKLLSDYCRTGGLLSEFTVGLSDQGSGTNKAQQSGGRQAGKQG